MPPVYSDHFLLSENLQQPYECPEHTSGIGILLTRKGNCNYYLNGLKYEVNHTNLLFVNRGSQLAIKITGKDAAPTLLFFHSKFVDLVQHSLLNGNEKLLEDPAGELPYDFSYLERIYNHPHFHETVCSLITLGSSCSSFASLKADITIRNLFEDLLKENQDSYRLSQNLQATKAATRLEIFKRVSLAKEWIEQNYNADSNLEEIASIAAMNSQHFLRMFKQIYHITPHQYRMELRLNKAKQLLDSTGLTMAEICQVIGFESAFSFSLLFKKRFGLPPSHFRNG
jgi:AraC-like DNA-binding protein